MKNHYHFINLLCLVVAVVSAETTSGSIKDAFEFSIGSFDINPTKWNDTVTAKMTKVGATSIALTCLNIPLPHVGAVALTILMLKKATWTACVSLSCAVYGLKWRERSFLAGGLAMFYLSAFSFWSGLP